LQHNDIQPKCTHVLSGNKEHQLVKACLAGDSHAWKTLYDHYKDLLFGLCMRYLCDRDKAEEVLQEGFIQVFRSLGSWRGDGPLGAWIRRVMLNSILYYIRKQLSNTTIQTVAIEDHHHIRQEPLADFEFNASDIIRLMHELPTGYRTVLNLYVLEEYTHEEIAKMLDISINTSKSQLSRAKDLLRKKIEAALLNDPKFEIYG